MDPEPLIGEPLALDLVNTLVGTGDEQVDLLASPEDVRRWLTLEADRLSPPGGEVDPGALRVLRWHITEAVEHAGQGTAPPADALRALGEAQRAAPRYHELIWADGTVVAVAHRSGDATRDVLAELAEAATDLLTDPAINTVRRCEGPVCRMLFLPAHPRRRWCSPQLCGNRVRVARYYRRHKGGAPQD